MNNLEAWNAMKTPPADALKEIKGGRLNGKHDINPVWRYEKMTDQFGMCGVGWRYSIDRLWPEAGADGQICVFAQVSVSVYSADLDGWSSPIPGVGGSMLVEKEAKGPHTSDEAYKMAVTDALGVAMKMLGMAADVYRGRMENVQTSSGSKYDKPQSDAGQKREYPSRAGDTRVITPGQLTRLFAKVGDGPHTSTEAAALTTKLGFSSSKEITREVYDGFCEWADGGPEPGAKEAPEPPEPNNEIPF